MFKYNQEREGVANRKSRTDRPNNGISSLPDIKPAYHLSLGSIRYHPRILWIGDLVSHEVTDGRSQ